MCSEEGRDRRKRTEERAKVVALALAARCQGQSLFKSPLSVCLPSVLRGASKRGASAQLATRPGLGAPRSCLNQSRCGSSIPCCRHHVSPAGRPHRGALRVRGVGGVECQFFSNSSQALQEGGRATAPSAPLWTWGVTPPGPHLHPGSDFRYSQFPSTKGPLWGFRERRNHASTIYFIYWNWRGCHPPSRASPEGPGTHRCSARSQRGDWCPVGRR